MGKENTFGEYKFEDWVPKHTRELIVSFWGEAGRDYTNWLENVKNGERERCSHGPGPNGFGNPPNGATVIYLLRDWKLSKQSGEEILKKVEGRYLHRWNNMGSLIDKYGEDHTVSSCDMWVRIFQKGEEVK